MFQRMTRRWVPAVAVSALVLLTVSGCGAGSGKVAGKVTYKAKPVTSGTITFWASDGRAVQGSIEKDGSYSVDKVPPGPAKVSVVSVNADRMGELFGRRSAIGGRPEPGKDKAAVAPAAPATEGSLSLIPERYGDQNTSGLTYTVKRGVNDYNIELK